MKTEGTRMSAAVAASGAAVILYFGLSFVFFPGFFHATLAHRHPAPELTSVILSPSPGQTVGVGKLVNISVVATNNGDAADVQTVSVGFPNITDAGQITIADQNFLQKPILISEG